MPISISHVYCLNTTQQNLRLREWGRGASSFITWFYPYILLYHCRSSIAALHAVSSKKDSSTRNIALFYIIIVIIWITWHQMEDYKPLLQDWWDEVQINMQCLRFNIMLWNKVLQLTRNYCGAPKTCLV